MNYMTPIELERNSEFCKDDRLWLVLNIICARAVLD